jgi:hypothetical protein
MTVYNSPKCTCNEVEVFHDIRRDGSRGACSVSTGATAVPCGCKAFQEPETAALFDLPDQPERGGPLL